MTPEIPKKKQRWPISAALGLGLLFLCIVVGLFSGLSGTAWATAPQEPALPSIDSHVGQMEVHFIDVGQGDAILVLAPEAAVLIDGGDGSSGVVGYLDGLGVQHLHMVIATHPHADHIGGLIDVLNSIPVDRVVTNGQEHTTLTYERFLDAVIAARAEYIEVGRGDRLEIGSIGFEVLHPSSLTSSLNEGSLVLRLSYGMVTSLFTGDLEGAAETELLATGLDLESEILKVAHHGSNSSSTDAFLARVVPEHAIILVGAENRYGHPHAEVLMRLEQFGAEIWRTDLEGTIVLRVDGDAGAYRLDAESGRTATSRTQSNLFLPLILMSIETATPTP